MAEGFWATLAGAFMRLAMLSESLEWGGFNEAIIRISTEQLKTLEFQMVGPVDERTCPICLPYVGAVFRLGEFMIDLPAHPNCRHWWEIYQPGREFA